MIRIATAFVLLAIATPALAADPDPALTKTATSSGPSKLRCKRAVVTGSLIETKKECHTEAEWHQITEQGRSTTLQLQNSLNSRGPN